MTLEEFEVEMRRRGVKRLTIYLHDTNQTTMIGERPESRLDQTETFANSGMVTFAQAVCAIIKSLDERDVQKGKT